MCSEARSSTSVQIWSTLLSTAYLTQVLTMAST